MKKRIVVVCPGRGSYTKETLGYLKNFGGHVSDFVADLDERRQEVSEPTITELDSAEVFKPHVHTKGEHASPLIYACAYADFTSINREKFEVVGILGNSMGWYITLALGGALDWEGGFKVINSMGAMMKDEIIGGQVIYPIVDDNWTQSKERRQVVHSALEKINRTAGCEVYISIYLGGYIVLGGNKAGVQALLKELPPVENYPFQLINHAAFHTPLLESISTKAFATLAPALFHRPNIPLIDGRGKIWQPYSTDIGELYDYTLGHQVVKPYDFTASVRVALKELAPDHLVLLGPGSTLGGSIGQIMIENDWLFVNSKAKFAELQAKNPFLISMGRADQRNFVL